MTWPLSQDYNEAIQDARASFQDAELQTGEATANALGIPMPRSGNFADVYEVRCPSGSRWAVKCFTREVHGLRERYQEISNYLRQANLPFMVDFHYLEQGIRVRGGWYPILKMQWVEGFVLNDFVRDNLDKKPILQALGQIWLRMAKRLREAKIAHCDLQHGNVMFVPGSTANSLAVKLIDYDGMCVPSLAGTKSGEVGHPAYQHPERLRTGAYNQEVDRFSLLSIAAALRCLSIGGRSLWERYDNGDNLLFRQADLQKPAESPLFQELLALRDPQAQSLVKELHRACQGALTAVPLVTELLPEEKPPAANRSRVSATTQAEAAPGPDWDFNEDEADAGIVKKRRASGKKPLWLWGALGGAAAVMLLGIGFGAALLLRKDIPPKEATPVAQRKPETNAPKPKEKPPAVENQPQPIVPAVPPVNPVEKPLVERPKPNKIFQISPNGDSLAVSNDGDKIFRLVDSRKKTLLRELSGHEGAIRNVAFSADGQRVLTSGDDEMLRCWDTATGQMIGTRKIHRPPAISIALSSDGKKAAIANGNTDVEVWNFESKTGAGFHNGAKVASVALSPDGRYLACGYSKGDQSNDNVAVFFWPLGPNIRPRQFRGSFPSIHRIAISPDGQYVATAHCGEGNDFTLWEMKSGKILWNDRTPSEPLDEIVFSPDSRFLLTSFGNQYRVWTVESKPRLVMTGSDVNQQGISATFSPDSRSVKFAYRKESFSYAQSAPLPAKLVGNPPAPASRPAPGWNPPVDPDGDCQFAESAGKLTIALPARKFHDLSVEGNRMNAPRLLRDIEGDFTVQVRISGEFAPQSVVAAGLLLLVDDKTYLRLERGYFGQASCCFWELREGGKKNAFSRILNLDESAGYVRLERRGRELRGSHSTDGKTWTELKPFEINLPAKVQVGVAAISVSPRFSPTFDQFQLQTGKGATIRIDKWLETKPSVVIKSPPPKPPARRVNRQPVPDERQQKEKREQLAAMRKDKYQGLADHPLANRLSTEAKSQADSALAYVMLNESRHLFGQVGDVYSALRVASELAAQFQVDPLAAQHAALQEVSQYKKGEYLLVQAGLPVVDQALSEEKDEVAVAVAALVQESALRRRHPLLETANQQAARTQRIKKERGKIQKDLRTLIDHPDDAKATRAVGRFYCAHQEDWDKGLPLLARGGDAALKKLANQDLNAPNTPTEQIALGAAWRARVGQTNDAAMKAACRRRAHYWYRRAFDQLSPGEKRKGVENALTKLENQMPELRDRWPHLGLYNNRVKRDPAAACLHLDTSCSLATRQWYAGPLDITVVVRADKNNVRIGVGKGGWLELGRMNDNNVEDGLRARRPDSSNPRSMAWGTMIANKPITLPANQWYTIRWQLRSTGMKAWIGDRLICEEKHDYDLTTKDPVRVECYLAPIDVKSIDVVRHREK